MCIDHAVRALLVGGPETRDGFVQLGDTPGFGVEIDWDYAKRYAA